MTELIKKKQQVHKYPVHIENFIVENMKDLRKIDAGLWEIGHADRNNNFIKGYGHSKLMAGLAGQLFNQGFFKKKDQKGHPVTMAKAMHFMQQRYHTPYLQRCYRDPEECMKYANDMLPIIKKIKNDRRCKFY